MRTPLPLTLAIVALGAVACSSSRMPSAPSELRSDEENAAYRIAAARCDRRTPACDGATGTHYPSRDACIDAKLFESAMQAELPACQDWPVDDQRLDECVQQIRQGRCGTGISNVEACRPKRLCPYRSEEGTVMNE